MNWDQIQSQWLAMTRRIRADLPDEDRRQKTAPLPGRSRTAKSSIILPDGLPDAGSPRNQHARDRLTVE
jgi:hypothetical protein